MGRIVFNSCTWTYHDAQSILCATRFVTIITILEQINQCAERSYSAPTVARLLAVYRTAIRALPRVAFFGLDNRNRLRALYKAETLASNACCLAISQGDITSAVKLFEKGQAVFWTHYLRLWDDFAELAPEVSKGLKPLQASCKRMAPRLSRRKQLTRGSWLDEGSSATSFQDINTES
jgi:hypothetical protein